MQIGESVIPTEHGTWGHDEHTGFRTLAWYGEQPKENSEEIPWLFVLLVDSDHDLAIDLATPFDVVYEDERVKGRSLLQTAYANAHHFPKGGVESALRCLMNQESSGIHVANITLVLGGFKHSDLETVLSQLGDQLPPDVRERLEQLLKKERPDQKSE